MQQLDWVRADDVVRGMMRAAGHDDRVCSPTPTNASSFAPEAGARCVDSARWDLRGGPPARAVPTAIASARVIDDRTCRTRTSLPG